LSIYALNKDFYQIVIDAFASVTGILL
jgi:hypothetical protein